MRIDQGFINYINNKIMIDASKLSYIIKDTAPSDEKSLFNSTSLVVWNGASNHTIFGDASVNWAFRALHDDLHLKTRLNFSPIQEIELGRIQASKYKGIFADLVYIEVAGQAEYYLKHGIFVKDQVQFTVDALNNLK